MLSNIKSTTQHPRWHFLVSKKLNLVHNLVSKKLNLVHNLVSKKLDLVHNFVSKKLDLVHNLVSKKLDLVPDLAFSFLVPGDIWYLSKFLEKKVNFLDINVLKHLKNAQVAKFLAEFHFQAAS